MSLQRTTRFAIGLGAATCLGPLFAASGAGHAAVGLGLLLMFFATIPLTVTWVLFVGYAFYKYGKEGWRTLLGAPPAIIALVVFARLSSSGWV
jgi:hypothetical protein